MFSGSLVALITPFTKEGSIDFPALQRLIEWHQNEESDGLVLLGTTGEASTLNEEEFSEIISFTSKLCASKIPFIVGTGSNDTRKTISLTQKAKKAGAKGCLAVIPYYNRPTFEGCLAHFQALAAVDLPIILYHHPGRTGVRLSASALATLSEIPQVVAIKEASGEVDLALHYMQIGSKPLLSGDDTLSLPLIAGGAHGVISVVANLIPKQWREMIALAQKGRVREAKEIFGRYFSLCKSIMLESNPMGVKFALSHLGLCEPYLRLPLVEPSLETRRVIQEELSKVMPLTSSILPNFPMAEVYAK
jgi:4-hydroxy-tetrahydrodipicolinate synthase